MADIFLSYARHDIKQAKQLADALTACGWDVWWDRTLAPGTRFRDEIARQLQAAKCVVVLWSRQSIESDWVVDEAEEAKRRGVLVQALVEDVQPPHGFRQIHSGSLIGWSGRADAQQLIDLRTGISRFVQVTHRRPLEPKSAFVGAYPSDSIHGSATTREQDRPVTPNQGLNHASLKTPIESSASGSRPLAAIRLVLSAVAGIACFVIVLLIVMNMSTADWESLGFVFTDTWDDQGRLIAKGED